MKGSYLSAMITIHFSYNISSMSVHCSWSHLWLVCLHHVPHLSLALCVDCCYESVLEMENLRDDLCVIGRSFGICLFLLVLVSVLEAMAGMLPGVECARRRRFHQGGSVMEGQSIKTRRSSFCLYPKSHDSHINSNSMQRIFTSQSFQRESLGDIARKAKERLDERLRTQRRSELRGNSTGNMTSKEERGESFYSVLREVFTRKKSSKKFTWAKLGGKASEVGEECVVCLEVFKPGELLVHLPCTHKYHSMCLVPWLETNAHCPYCRTEILF